MTALKSYESFSSRGIENILSKRKPYFSSYVILEVRGDNQVFLCQEQVDLIRSGLCNAIIIAGDFPLSLIMDKDNYIQQLVFVCGLEKIFAKVILHPLFVPTPFYQEMFSEYLDAPLDRVLYEDLDSKTELYRRPPIWRYSHDINYTYGYKGISFSDPRNPLSCTLPKKPSPADLRKFKKITQNQKDCFEFLGIKYGHFDYLKQVVGKNIALDCSAINAQYLPKALREMELEWLNLGANPLMDFDYRNTPKTLKTLLLHKSGFQDIEGVLTYCAQLERLSVYRSQVTRIPKAAAFSNIRSLNIGATKIPSKALKSLPTIFPFLEELNISNMGLSKIPFEIGEFELLTNLNLEKNYISQNDLDKVSRDSPYLKLRTSKTWFR